MNFGGTNSGFGFNSQNNMNQGGNSGFNSMQGNNTNMGNGNAFGNMSNPNNNNSMFGNTFLLMRCATYSGSSFPDLETETK